MLRPRPVRLAVVALALVAVAAGRRAAAANFVANGGFATNVAGWAIEDAASVVLLWDSADAAGSAASGSARVRNTSVGAANGIGIRQCAGAVVAGDAYTFGGKVRFPAGQARTGFAAIKLRFYSGPGCTGTPLVQPLLQTFTPGNTFVPLSQDGTVPPGAKSVEFAAFPSKIEAGGQLEALFDDLFFDSAPCVGSATALCLNSGRFRVQASWRTGQGTSGDAQVVKLTADTGYLWFFDSTNVEAVVKVLDGCGLNSHYWVFAGGLTNVEVDLSVSDTQTGDSKTYHNALNKTFQPIQDTGAFAACP